MLPNVPDISGHGKSGLFKLRLHIKIIFFCILIAIERRELFIIKARKGHVKIQVLKRLHLHGQKVSVPPRVQRRAVDGKNIRFLFRVRHAGKHHIRKLRHALCLGGLHSAVTGENSKVLIHLHRITIADAAVDGPQLIDLLFAVGAGVIGIGDELIHRCHRVVFGKYLDIAHLISPHSANSSNPPIF